MRIYKPTEKAAISIMLQFRSFDVFFGVEKENLSQMNQFVS